MQGLVRNAQVAQLSARVQQLTAHLQTHRKDFACRRGLVILLGQRRRLMQYLYKVNRWAPKPYTMFMVNRWARGPAHLACTLRAFSCMTQEHPVAPHLLHTCKHAAAILPKKAGTLCKSCEAHADTLRRPIYDEVLETLGVRR